uniref:ATP-dependent Clp protease proteolytic subunit n=1 Tax=Mammillaria albiflora TaxID=867404 RepID=A0A5J6VAD3_9CARY|nr:clp protease proteolytic subunit [Mammillaria albiflora]
MPLSTSIPKVPVRFPGDEEDSWVDLNEELNRNNIIFLCDELEAEISNEIMALMIYLGEDKTQSLYFFINSPGGEVINGIAIDNVMQLIRSPVMTICLGIAASMASYILAGGAYKKRVAFPHARIMIHQPSANLNKYKDEDEDEDEEVESIDLLYAEFTELLNLRETLARGYSKRTGKPLWIISQDIERDVYMSATEAQAYGIVDHVGI